eukprot:jgi/Psemu1/5277/gm1.5277_g
MANIARDGDTRDTTKKTSITTMPTMKTTTTAATTQESPTAAERETPQKRKAENISVMDSDSESESDSDSDSSLVGEDNVGSSNKNTDNSKEIDVTLMVQKLTEDLSKNPELLEKILTTVSDSKKRENSKEDAAQTTGMVPLKTVQSGNSIDKTIEGQVRAYVKEIWYGGMKFLKSKESSKRVMVQGIDAGRISVTKDIPIKEFCIIIKHWQEKIGLVSVGAMVESDGDSFAVDILLYVPTSDILLTPPYNDIILPFVVITVADSEKAKGPASSPGSTVALNPESVEITFNGYRRYGNADNEEFYYFVTRILSAVNPVGTNFKQKKATMLISDIFSVTDEAFALMIIENEYRNWEKQKQRKLDGTDATQTKKKYMRKKHCDSKMFARLCKKIKTLREDPETGKKLEKMMLERFKSEKNPTVSKDGGTVASSLAEEENEDDNYIDPVLMQLLGGMEEFDFDPESLEKIEFKHTSTTNGVSETVKWDEYVTVQNNQTAPNFAIAINAFITYKFNNNTGAQWCHKRFLNNIKKATNTTNASINDEAFKSLIFESMPTRWKDSYEERHSPYEAVTTTTTTATTITIKTIVLETIEITIGTTTTKTDNTVTTTTTTTTTTKTTTQEEYQKPHLCFLNANNPNWPNRNNGNNNNDKHVNDCNSNSIRSSNSSSSFGNNSYEPEQHVCVFIKQPLEETTSEPWEDLFHVDIKIDSEHYNSDLQRFSKTSNSINKNSNVASSSNIDNDTDLAPTKTFFNS